MNAPVPRKNFEISYRNIVKARGALGSFYSQSKCIDSLIIWSKTNCKWYPHFLQ